MSRVYFWKNDQVEIVHRFLTVHDFEHSFMLKYLYCPCVDTHAINLEDRYGAFIQESNGRLATVRWDYLPMDSFPPEFRAHLLLLGVS
jgi:hypothetical protein